MAEGTGSPGWATGVEGFGERDGEIGIGSWVGSSGGLTSGESCRWAVADFVGFFLDA